MIRLHEVHVWMLVKVVQDLDQVHPKRNTQGLHAHSYFFAIVILGLFVMSYVAAFYAAHMHTAKLLCILVRNL